MTDVVSVDPFELAAGEARAIDLAAR
jgi:hypothetical protein